VALRPGDLVRRLAAHGQRQAAPLDQEQIIFGGDVADALGLLPCGAGPAPTGSHFLG
jgi:hypothetical protein